NEDQSAFQRRFTKEIRRLDNVERQIRFFYAQMEKNNIKVRGDDVIDVADIAAAPSEGEVNELALQTDALEARITQLNDSYETLQKRWVELIEYRWVLREAGGFFDRAYGHTQEIQSFA